MSVMDRINIGVVGVCGGCGRGGQMIDALNSVPPMHVHAVCDIDRERLDEANKKLGVAEVYYDYDEMLEKSDLDAVFIATPMDLHVPQSIAALTKGLHVLCEVTAAVSLEECKELVTACEASDAVYMMGENYNYHRPAAMIREMVVGGQFGTPYYAEAGYVADLKKLAEVTPWRRKWQIGVNGVTYVTHSLGPILEWMPGERVVSVCCSGSGHHYVDPRGDLYETEDNCTMMCKTGSGRQIVIRSDFLSDGPGLGTYYALQGTEGWYESPRGAGQKHQVWLRSKSKETKWMDLEDFEEEFLPDYWRAAISKGLNVGPDHFQVADFVNAVQGKGPNPVGIHKTMDLTIPGLVSQLSIADGGRWMAVPDSREW